MLIFLGSWGAKTKGGSLKIYKYSNGKVHELEVRETAKMYIPVEGTRYDGPFGCQSWFRKDEASLSPEEAVETIRGQLARLIDRANERLSYLNKRLNMLEDCSRRMRAANNKK
jgi:hypothetical protein